MNAVAIAFDVAVLNPHSHLFAVTMRVAQPSTEQVLSLPVWIPGSYMVREFSQHLQRLRAEQGGQPCAVRQLNKHQWQVSCDPTQPLVVKHEVYAFDASVRTAWLDSQRGFFNATSLCLRVVGQTDAPHQLQLVDNEHTTHWSAITGLRAEHIDERGWGTYLARDYDELADCPVEMGTFWRGDFVARGVPHSFVVSGAGAFDGARLLADTQRICETEIDFWHGTDAPAGSAPFDRYVFMLNATADGYGGLEHRNSTALIAQRNDLPAVGTAPPTALKATDGYTTLLGLISHEYFHTWNVKRLRPCELTTIDYDRENHSELLWWFEGFTSYYDDLILRRAGLIDNPTYLQLVAKHHNQVLQTPGRQLQSVAQASFDAWTKYYRMGENTPNATVSYYTKGALVALCLDLSLRHEGRTTLDAVVRSLWQSSQGGPISENDIEQALLSCSGRSWQTELQAWVHGTHDLPVVGCLERHGVKISQEPAPIAQQLGVRVSESGGAVRLKTVLRDGAAEAAGMAAGDEWLGVEVSNQGDLPTEAWRLNTLDTLPRWLGPRTEFTALIARDQRLLRCPVRLRHVENVVRLADSEHPALTLWLNPSPQQETP
jgi:predicted metalloprotease with PDZ domain